MSFQAKVKEAFGSEKWMKERLEGLVFCRKTVKWFKENKWLFSQFLVYNHTNLCSSVAFGLVDTLLDTDTIQITPFGKRRHLTHSVPEL
jgi:hypothetical protein